MKYQTLLSDIYEIPKPVRQYTPDSFNHTNHIYLLDENISVNVFRNLLSDKVVKFFQYLSVLFKMKIQK